MKMPERDRKLFNQIYRKRAQDFSENMSQYRHPRHMGSPLVGTGLCSRCCSGNHCCSGSRCWSRHRMGSPLGCTRLCSRCCHRGGGGGHMGSLMGKDSMTLGIARMGMSRLGMTPLSMELGSRMCLSMELGSRMCPSMELGSRMVLGMGPGSGMTLGMGSHMRLGMVCSLGIRSRCRHRSSMGFHWGRSLGKVCRMGMRSIQMSMVEEYSMAKIHHREHKMGQGNIHHTPCRTRSCRLHKVPEGSNLGKECLRDRDRWVLWSKLGRSLLGLTSKRGGLRIGLLRGHPAQYLRPLRGLQPKL